MLDKVISKAYNTHTIKNLISYRLWRGKETVNNVTNF